LNGNNYIKPSFVYKGLNQKPVTDESIKIPSATMDLFKLTSKQKMSTHFPLPGLHTATANTARIYNNKGN